MTVQLRAATAANIPLLERWDREPHVIASGALNDGPIDWAAEIALDPELHETLIAEANGRPVGVLSIIDCAREETHYWGRVDEELRAIDIWIGETDALGRGFGTQMMRLALARCFSDSRVAAVLVDPLKANVRAHRFYERCGFRAVEDRWFGDDECVVHRIDRPVHRGT